MTRRELHLVCRPRDREVMKIKELPPGVVAELCRYLNVEGDGQRNWKELISRIPGRVYTVYDVSAFALAGQRAHTSPAEEVIMDLITLGMTVDSLYRILHTMDARQCMETLAEYVSAEVIDEVEALRQRDVEKAAYQPEPLTGVDPGGPSVDGDVHPVYGPLPNPPPPTSSQEQQQQQQRLRQIHHQIVAPPPRSHAPTQQYRSQSNGGSFTHNSVSNGYSHASHGSQMQGASASPPQNHYSSYSASVLPSQRGNSSLSSTSSSYEVDKGHRHPSPSSLLSQSSSNYQNGNGTALGAPSSANYYSQSHTTTATITAGKSYQSQSKDYPHNYPQPSSSGLPTTNQQELKGASPLYHHHKQAATTKQPPSYSPSWPSTYSSSSSSLEQSNYSYASFHNTSSSIDAVQQHQPMMSHPPVGHMTTPSYSEGSRYSSSGSSSGYSHTGGSSSSTFTSSGPLRKDERSKEEEKSVEPNILKFTYAELSEATDGFVKDMLGLGSFGTVFRAKIRGTGPYAVKKLYSEREMGGGVFYEPLYRETFTQELRMLTKYHHRNILSLVAYSNDGPTPCLVYEYMESGSLADCFQGKRNISLLWDLRLQIANQIADALHFLHTVNKPKSVLVHGDVKSANILLDAHCVPKLSDFGLARECSTSSSQSTTINTKSDIIMGTMAYLAPEFIRNKKFKPSADVYSFGVVLLELYTGQLALSDVPTHQERVLTTRLANLIDDGSENHQHEVLMRADPKAYWPSQTGLEMFDIATVCLRHKPRLRPPMEQVLDQLHLISTPQQSPPGVGVGSPPPLGHSYDSPYAASWH